MLGSDRSCRGLTLVARDTECWGRTEVAGTDVTEVAGTDVTEVAGTDVTEVARGTECWGRAEIAGTDVGVLRWNRSCEGLTSEVAGLTSLKLLGVRVLGSDRSCGGLTSLKLLGVQSSGVGQELRGTDVTEVATGTECWGRAEVAGD